MAKNPYLVQFRADLRARYPTDGADMSYSAWISANTTLGGRPFGYAGYEFQRQIADDMSPDMCVIKLSQVGMTEVQVRKFLAFLTRNRGTSGIFSFPNEKMFKNNSKTRIGPIVKQPAFNSGGLDDDKPSRSMNLYEINGSWAHITGLTEGDATSTPADILFHDEVDLSDQAMLALMQSRLQNSDFRITHKFSTPTHPGFGIDASYAASDKHEFLLRCEGCSHWQAPKFSMPFLCLPGYRGEGNLEDLDADGVGLLDLKGCYVKCERCSRQLDLRNPEIREWVPEHPSRMGRGYRIRPFSTSRITIPYILGQLLKMKQMDNIKGWYNTVLGETYSDGNSKLEPDVVKAVMMEPGVPEVSRLVPVALGCDMGKTCHLVLGEASTGNPILFEQVPSSQVVERIAQLRERYNIVAGAVDRLPYTPTAEEIRDTSGRLILPTQYATGPFIQLKDDEYGVLDFALVNRTKVLDNTVRAIQRKAIEIRGYGNLQSVIVEQCCDIVRIEADEKPATWEKLTGNDHFIHAMALMRASTSIHELVLAREETPKQLFGFGTVTSSTSTKALGQLARGRHNQRTL